MKVLKNYKRVLAVLLVILMLLVSAACGNRPASNTPDSTDDTTTEKPSDSEGTTVDPTDEPEADHSKDPITLTVAIKENPGLSDGINNAPILDEIIKATGITIDFVTTTKDKFKIQVAGGDLSDIVILPDAPEMAPTLISSGSVIPLDDLLETHGQNILKNIPMALKWEKEIIGDGKIYYLPVGTSQLDKNNPQPNGYVGFFSRWDVYKAIGAPEMKNEDDFLTVMQQMQEYQPTTKDGKKIYALSAWTDWGTWPYIIQYPLANGFLNKGDYSSVNRETGELESNLLKEDSIFWKGIAFWNKAYRKGVFDPEGFTMKWDQYIKKVQTGEILNSALFSVSVDPKLTNEDAAMVVLPGAFPYIPGIFPGESLIGFGNGNARAISSSCEYPERAMQLINYFDSTEGARTIINGVQGVDWDVIDEVPQLIGEHLEAVKSGSMADFKIKTLIGVLGGHTTGSVIPEDGYPVNLKNTPQMAADGATLGQKDFAKTYDPSFTFPGQVYTKLFNEGKVKTDFGAPSLGFSLMADATSDTTAQTLSKGTQYFSANVSKIIMAEDDESFAEEKAKVIEDIKAMGYEKAFEEVLELYEVGKATASKFAE